jgi:hypothetical protein
MATRSSIGDLVQKQALVTELYFTLTGESQPDSLPSLALLLAAGSSPEPGAICFMYPRADRIVLATAVLGALARLGEEFPSLLEAYAHRGFRNGQRVRVLPTGHVYEFDGLFKDLDGPFRGLFFRLRVLEPLRMRWSKNTISQPTVRAFPVDQILRLQPTERSSPRGKENTPLGAWYPSAIDRLIGIRTGGNTALFRNHVLVLTTRSEAERFAATTSLISGRRVGSIDKALTWGKIGENGEIESEGRSQDVPLVAVTHTVDLLALACESAPPCSKLVLVDGLAALSRNIQAYDRIARCQRLVIVADHDDEDQVQDLVSRGCQLWPLTAAEILYDRKTLSAPVFQAVRWGALNAEALEVTHVPVVDDALSYAAEALFRAERALTKDSDEGLKRVLRSAFGGLVQAASWFCQPVGQELRDFEGYLKRLESLIDNQGFWAPEGFATDLKEVVQFFRIMLTADETGAGRLNALRAAVADLERAGKRTVVIAKTASVVDSLKVLLRTNDSAPIYTPTTFPADTTSDALIVTSWLKETVLRHLINKHATQDVRVLGCAFEQQWLLGTLRARRSRQSRWTIDDNARAAITGVANWAGESSDRDAASRANAAGAPALTEDRTLDPLRALGPWEGAERKGSAPEEVPEDERREARYVGFTGRGYAYLTPGRSLPVVTDLIIGVDRSKARVTIRNIDHLRPGEYVLFRDHGDHDIIELIAEGIVGAQKYREKRKVAELWKNALRSTGTTAADIYTRLRVAGLQKHIATIRSWLLDEDKIGPGNRSDLDYIAQATQDRNFQAQVARTWDAIREIRSAHIVAGQRLSELLLNELPQRLPKVTDRETRVDLTLGQAWIVEIEEIGELEDRPVADVNRLLWDNGAF